MPPQAQVATRGISAFEDIVAMCMVIDVPGNPDQISTDVRLDSKEEEGSEGEDDELMWGPLSVS